MTDSILRVSRIPGQLPHTCQGDGCHICGAEEAELADTPPEWPVDDHDHTPPHGDPLSSASLLRRAIEHVKNPNNDSRILTTRADTEAVGDPPPPVTYRIAFATHQMVDADTVIKIDIARQPPDLPISRCLSVGV